MTFAIKVNRLPKGKRMPTGRGGAPPLALDLAEAQRYGIENYYQELDILITLISHAWAWGEIPWML